MTDIDGIHVGEGGASFALSVSDALGDAAAVERISRVMALAGECGHLRFLCIRNDTRDPERFARAAYIAGACELGLVLESADPVCLREALTVLEVRRPLLCVTDPDRLAEASLLSAVSGCPVAVPGRGVQDLMDNAEAALETGAASVVLCPDVPNMKSCLETCTDVCRLRAEHGILPDSPLMVRSWSGEYALSVGSVAVMRGCGLVVLDDLDPEACRVLDSLMSSFEL